MSGERPPARDERRAPSEAEAPALLHDLAVGDEYLQRALATDDGSRFLGEIGIGTNFGIARPTGTILFDEKIGGTVHLALGRSYPETGGKNKSALHWDLICDLRRGGQITADGELIQRAGAFAR